MTRVLLLVPMLALVGCVSEAVTADGRFLDSAGAPLAGVPVVLAEPAWGRFLDDPQIGRELARTSTDADGRFSLAYAVTSCPTCTADLDAFRLFYGPDARGTTATSAEYYYDGHTFAFSLDDVRLPEPAELSVKPDSSLLVGLAVEPALVPVLEPELEPELEIDGWRWLVPPGGAIPAEAMIDCEVQGACAHPVRLRWHVSSLELVGPASSVTSDPPRPIAKSTGDRIVFPSPTRVGVVYIDDLRFLAPGARGGDYSPSIFVKTAASGPGGSYEPLAAGSCETYGSGLRCRVPQEPLELIMTTTVATQLRAFAP